MPDEAYLASPQSYNYKQPLTSASESYSLATGTALLSPPLPVRHKSLSLQVLPAHRGPTRTQPGP